jgi:hypothetical protein
LKAEVAVRDALKKILPQNSGGLPENHPASKAALQFYGRPVNSALAKTAWVL